MPRHKANTRESDTHDQPAIIATSSAVVHGVNSKSSSTSLSSTNQTSAIVKSIAQVSFSQWLIVISLIMGGCCSNVYTLEKIISDVPKSGDLVTFTQFAFVAIEGLIGHLQFSRHGLLKPRAVPIINWIYMVLLFFTLSTLNNRALGYRISIPLHIVFRSGGLLVNMLFGWLLAGRRYNVMQIGAIMLVTGGVMLATIYSSASSSTSSGTVEDDTSYSEWLIGITLLVTAMFLTAGLGLLQERTYAIYGKHWRESMFYVHFLSLPMFFLVRNDIMQQLATVNASPMIHLDQWTLNYLPKDVATLVNLFIPRVAIPELWIYLALNVLTQYVCITGVNRLTSITSSLTVNLTLNIRKMTSLLLSVWLFGNHLGLLASLGCIFVFIGTLLYSYASTKKPATTTIKLSAVTADKLAKQQ